MKFKFKATLLFSAIPVIFAVTCLAQDQTDSVAPIYNPSYFTELLSRAEKANQNIALRQSRTYGTLTIRSGELTDAAVYLEGPSTAKGSALFLAGRTPLQNIKLHTGKHTVHLQHPKAHSLVDTVSITENGSQNINLNLLQKRAAVKVITKPAGVKVTFGGRQLGVTGDSAFILPLYEKGQYMLQFEREGYQTLRQSLRVLDGEIHCANVNLTPNYASVKISTKEEGFYAYVNNIYRGRTPLKVTGLLPGHVSIRVEQDKYAATTITSMLRAGETSAVVLNPAQDKSVRDVSPYGELKSTWSDKDGDGLPNDIDNCKEDPEDIDGYEDSDGCPDNDNDKDNVPDIKDKCPNEAEDLDGINDPDGCPDKDNDADNIPDSLDMCPHTAEDRDGMEDFDGCPEPDNDLDLIHDSTDVAINEPEDRDGFQDNDGVQDRDNDNDGVWDYMDLCPDSAEVFNNYQDDDGCPDVRLTEPQKGIVARLPFRMDEKFKDTVLAAIDSAYDAMQAYPDMQIEIKVHSDNRGNAPKKLENTKQAARLIAAYMDARKRIPSSRYTVSGVGGNDPIASNVSEEGRQKNTRIEIIRTK
ncbi:MAG: PEGA domain-containing protein [Fibrobacteres bacterium]|nr:PEGA domain-containing protein [Fibrobacterota bacterium]